MEKRTITIEVDEETYQYLVRLKAETKKGWLGFWMLCARSYCNENIRAVGPQPISSLERTIVHPGASHYWRAIQIFMRTYRHLIDA